MNDDSEPCSECKLDHSKEATAAIAWHKEHPCATCSFDRSKGLHEPKCPTQTIVRGGLILTEQRVQCSQCTRTVKNGYTICYTCAKNNYRK